MREVVDRARELFCEGLPLARMVDRRLAIDLDLFSRGGMRVLDKIEQQGYDVLAARPAISKVERVGLLLGSLARVAFSAGGVMTRIDESYAILPQRGAQPRQELLLLLSSCSRAQQRNAMCAIYAFMRYCDDLSDEPGASRTAWTAGARDMEEALAGPLRRPSLRGRRFTTRCAASASRTNISTR